MNAPRAADEGSIQFLIGSPVAVSATGAARSQPYERPLLVLVLPDLDELFTSGRGKDRAVALLIAGFAAFAMMPGGEGGMAENFAHSVGDFAQRIGWPWDVTSVLLSHRSLGAFAVATTVLARGAVSHTSPSRI